MTGSVMGFQEIDGLMRCTTHNEPIDETNDNKCRGDWDDDCDVVPLYIGLAESPARGADTEPPPEVD